MNVNVLRDMLERLPPGPLVESRREEVLALLITCWEHFAGWRAHDMEPYKLYRAQCLHWTPPVLTFVLERGGESQQWAVDLATVQVSRLS